MNRFIEPPELPLIAILRGLRPDRALETGRILLEEGFSILEVPLNRPRALECISILAENYGSAALIGAGTVISIEGVRSVKDAGGRLIVSPDTNPEVIREARNADLYCLPGAATPTEAFAAVRAGATGLKVFPAVTIGPASIREWKAVLPTGTLFFPVGGITPGNMAEFVVAGAVGFGLGSSLFDPEMDPEELRLRAAAFREAFRAIRKTYPG